jgi:hypothetical protein
VTQPIPSVVYHFTDVPPEAMEGMVLQPNGPLDLVFLTAIRTPLPQALGLPFPKVLHRYRVLDLGDVHSWVDDQEQYDMHTWLPWELAEGAKPDRWFVSSKPVPVKYDPIRS